MTDVVIPVGPDPITTQPIIASDLSSASAEDIFLLEQTVLAPSLQTTQQTIGPNVITPAMIDNAWTAFDCRPHSKWQFTINGGGTTIRNGSDPTPGFAMGNAVIQARYYKVGRFVFVKIRGTLGTSTTWSNLQLQSSGLATWGDFGLVYFDLPIKGPANDFSFATAILHETHTILTTSSQPIITLPLESNIVATPANNQGILSTNMLVRNSATEVPAAFFQAASQGPLTYNSVTPGAQFTVAGDSFDFQLKYEVDVDS